MLFPLTPLAVMVLSPSGIISARLLISLKLVVEPGMEAAIQREERIAHGIEPARCCCRYLCLAFSSSSGWVHGVYRCLGGLQIGIALCHQADVPKARGSPLHPSQFLRPASCSPDLIVIFSGSVFEMGIASGVYRLMVSASFMATLIWERWRQRHFSALQRLWSSQ